MDVPEVRYARSGDVSIAYQVVGSGSADIVLVPDWVSNLVWAWRSPYWVRFYERLTSFSRLILFDKRGTGLSDRPRVFPDLETRMDDVRAVLDAAGSERAVLVGGQEGCWLASLFAATYPARTLGLVLYNPWLRGSPASDDPNDPTREDPTLLELREIRDGWGSRKFADDLLSRIGPTLYEDDDSRAWFADWLRLGASPAGAEAFHRMIREGDLSDVYPAVHVPTLVLSRAWVTRDPAVVAELIPGARTVEVPGRDYMGIFLGEEIPAEIEGFVASLGKELEQERVLATLLFTDIVGSTERAAEVGDRSWRELLDEHHALVRRELTRFRGVEVDTAGDGFLATFDGPARAIRGACAIVEGMQARGLQIRAALHTGECELVGGKVAGLAVHTGARIVAQAKPNEVLVSSTVKDLVAGSGIEFEDRGVHELKGVPGKWRLYAVSSA